jgi:hypothetical protein
MAAKKENNKVKLENSENWFSKMIHYFNTLLEKYMGKYPHYTELKEFMKDEKNLYKDDGSLEDKYEDWIKDVNKFASENPASEMLNEEYKGDKIRRALVKGIEEYINTDKELQKLYEETRREEKCTPDIEEWIYDRICESSKNDEEADKKFNDLADMINSGTLELLERNTKLRTILKDRIEEDGEGQ